MARTAKAEAQVVRREAFVDVATRLIQTRGYEQMSVQDVLDELDASKGAFYHYFDSKRALLQAVVERMVDLALATLAPVLDDPHLSALEKMEGVFGRIAAWKGQRRELLLAVIETWTSDDNAIVREKVRRTTDSRLVPLLAAIIGQGVSEGLFAAESPHDTAIAIMSLLHGFQEVATDLFFARRANTVTYEDFERTYTAQLRVFDRVLGLPPGSFKGLDRDTLRFWFG
jgi:AcrR family transcriptional regulator